MPKVRVEIVVKDEDLHRVIDAIIIAANTGAVGDGKIFITNASQVIRIRTGESGNEAI